MTNAMPQLTLEPQLDVNAETQAAIEKEVPKAPEVDMKDALTAEEQQAVDAFAKQIDVTNANQVLMYGANAQKNIANFSENALNNVRNKDLGEVGEALSGLVVELKSLDFDDDEEKKGFFASLFEKAEANSSSLLFTIIMILSFPLLIVLAFLCIGTLVSLYFALAAVILALVLLIIFIVCGGTLTSLVALLYGATQVMQAPRYVGIHEIGLV